MQKQRLLAFALCGIFIGVDAKIPVIGSAFNKLSGFLGHSSESLLKPENEALVHAVAQQMGLTEKFSVYARPGMGPHATGDRIYFDDAWFEKYKNSPEVLRFIIGHELAHVENHDVPKRHFLRMAALLACPVVAYVLMNNSPLPRLFYNNKREYPMKMDGLDALAFSLGMTGGILMHLKVCRMQEFEADKFSLEKLKDAYDSESLVQGAGTYFSEVTSFAPYSFFESCFATHPHSRERLQALIFPESSSVKAGEKMIPLLKRLHMRLFCSLFGDFNVQEYNGLWNEI